ncbi:MULTISPECIES: alpha/beta hydrolase [unclassified Arthrobacter]|jgi:pimeloyl-ACP methyl ester carboxylesterase|uniref:esterase/lipase family protein n=1 Tax=unclassified Arthrobacter TaxID=235627 RepID=UPI0009A5E13A|nr:MULTISPECIES: alpha/beta hydrolase [unclassified Arthrobacter]MDF2049296.1 alpha/beta hydrolase [Arthrobacter sp. Cr_A7]RDV08049.1 alpha/beta hydrolase [Arthrobacter sp. RT-1]SLK00376.1 Triacylglycerol esterase/lipase EstA, alpha/beta hydrolase fold [Arthrobacter sp. P2b]
MSETGAPARSSPLQKAVWWAQDYVYAAVCQVQGMLSRVQPGSFHKGHLSPVLIIPGVYENWQFMMPLIRSIHDAGHPVHVVTVLQRNKLDVPVAARLVAQHLEEAGLRDAAIVAHSKGGLIGKYAMLNLDPEGRISRMITVCTPFSGSRYAKYMLLPSLRIFSPSNALTLQLAREEAINSRITSIYGPFDPHIPEGSVLPGATNIELPTAGHFRILGDHETARIIVEQLTPDEP